MPTQPGFLVRHGTVLVLLLNSVGMTCFGQDQADQRSRDKSTEARPKPGRTRLSESRADEKATPLVEDAKAPSEPIPKKADEAESSSNGFFGDPKKFTKLGGWGSFGNAIGQFGFARSTLIMMPPVQEELKLTDEQKKKIKDWQEGMRKKGEEMGRSMREKNGDDPFKNSENLPIAVRVFQFTSLMNQVSSFVKDNENGLAKILNAPQRKRLSQIALQMEGISALTRPEIVEALGMTEEDLEQIQVILNQSRTQQMTTWIGSMMAMRPTQQPKNDRTQPGAIEKSDQVAKLDDKKDVRPRSETDPKSKLSQEKERKQRFEAMRDRTDQIQSIAVKEVLNVLTRPQRAKFEILLGPPFDPRKINNLGRPPREEKTSTSSEPKTPLEPKPNKD